MGQKDGRADIRKDGKPTEGRKDGKPKTMSLRIPSKMRGTKIDPRIISKSHAHLQSMVKTSVTVLKESE